MYQKGLFVRLKLFPFINLLHIDISLNIRTILLDRCSIILNTNQVLQNEETVSKNFQLSKAELKKVKDMGDKCSLKVTGVMKYKTSPVEV